jgi:hypothetical protein
LATVVLENLIPVLRTGLALLVMKEYYYFFFHVFIFWKFWSMMGLMGDVRFDEADLLGQRGEFDIGNLSKYRSMELSIG